VPLSFGEQLTILIVAMRTSKGASGVTTAGFITLAATLASVTTRSRIYSENTASSRQCASLDIFVNPLR